MPKKKKKDSKAKNKPKSPISITFMVGDKVIFRLDTDSKKEVIRILEESDFYKKKAR